MTALVVRAVIQSSIDQEPGLGGPRGRGRGLQTPRSDLAYYPTLASYLDQISKKKKIDKKQKRQTRLGKSVSSTDSFERAEQTANISNKNKHVPKRVYCETFTLLETTLHWLPLKQKSKYLC